MEKKNNERRVHIREFKMEAVALAEKRTERPPQKEVYLNDRLETTLPVSENILNRGFHAEKGGQKWVSDITYLRTRGGM